MRLLTIVFSNHCDLDCTYCCVQSKNLSPVNANFKQIKEFIDKYVEDESCIEFYGGEPTLHKDLIKEILDYIDSLDVEVYTRLYTNGMFKDWTDEEIVSVSNRISETLISLDGFTFEENKQRFETEDEFNQVMNNIKIVLTTSTFLGISTVLYGRAKFENMFNNYKLFRSIGVNYFSYEPLTIYNDNRPVVIPKEFFKEFLIQINTIYQDSIENYPDDTYLFVAKELLSSKWFNQGERTQCSKMVRAISPRGNVYMCRDHAANEEELFYGPKVIQFLNKNNFKNDNESFPVIEQNENNLTPCPVKNIQYRDSKVNGSLYWLEDKVQELYIEPLYRAIQVLDNKRKEAYNDMLTYSKTVTKYLMKEDANEIFKVSIN